MVEKLNNVVHVERQLVQKLGREPTPRRSPTSCAGSPREVRDVLRISQLPISLEKPIGEDEDSALGDFVEDESAASPFETRDRDHAARERLARARARCRERERQVIELRYGLDRRAAAARSRRSAAPSASPASGSARSRTTR